MASSSSSSSSAKWAVWAALGVATSGSLLLSVHRQRRVRAAAAATTAATAAAAAALAARMLPDEPPLTYNYLVPTVFPELKNDNFLRAIRGEPVSHVPIWIHRQAGRYLPEFLETRKSRSFMALCTMPEVAREVTLQPLRRFPLDASIIFSDILIIPIVLGVPFDYGGGKGPFSPTPVRTPSDVKRVARKLDISKLTYVYEAIRITRIAINGQCPLIGFIGGPWTLICYMIEGSTDKDMPLCKKFLAEHPAAFFELFDILIDACVDHIVEQARGGAQVLQVFESRANLVAPGKGTPLLRDPMLKLGRAVRAKLKALGINVPITAYVTGNDLAIAEIAASGVYDTISVDQNLTDEQARYWTRPCTLQGNFDPELLHKPESEIRETVRAKVHAFGLHRWVANSGGGMLPSHKPEAVATIVDELHSYSSAIRRAIVEGLATCETEKASTTVADIVISYY